MKKRVGMILLAALLLLEGCMLPRMFVAAFIPFQRLMIWGAAMGARYGAPLVMLLVENDPIDDPGLTPYTGEDRTLFCEKASKEFLESRASLRKVYVLDASAIREEEYAAIVDNVGKEGGFLYAVPVEREDLEAIKADLIARGVAWEGVNL